MKSLYLAIALVGSFAARAAEPQTYASIMAEAETAFAAEDWATVADRIDAAQEIRPYSLYLTRNRILARAMLGDFDAADAIARQIADRGLSVALRGHPGFERLTARPEFASISARMTENLSPRGSARVVRTHGDDGLLPEAYARDAKKGVDYVGSVRTGKILRLDAAGAEGFAIAPGGVYAIEIDGGDVWAAANSGAPYESAVEGEARSTVLRYAAKDGKQLAAFPAPEGAATIGALEMTPAGLVASDSATPRLLILRKGETSLDTLSADPRFVNLQGVAYDASRKRLYVADYLAGLFAVDPETGAATPVSNAANAHLGGIDGLGLYKGDLIGIQNGTQPQRIVRLRLSKSGDSVEALDILQQALPEWNEPTNGAIVGDALLYVATSNWPAYADDGSVRENVQRLPLTLMSVDLR